MTIHNMLTRSKLMHLSESDKLLVNLLLYMKYSNAPRNMRTKNKKEKTININTNMNPFEKFEKDYANLYTNEKFTMTFDTETTGLFPKINTDDNHRNNSIEYIMNLPIEMLNTYPYITQLSFILYDIEQKKPVFSFNSYIRIPEDIAISEEITKLTGVTREKCNAGISIQDALELFYKASKYCDTIVAHNIQFDRNMILLECKRNAEALNNVDSIYAMLNYYENRIRVRCSMKSGFQYLNLKKFPRLSELHELLFNETVESYNIPLHNALVDTLVCLRCSLKIFNNIHISREEFTESIATIFL